MSIVRNSSQPLRYEADGSVKRIGLLALATDLTIERDLARIIPGDRAGIHTTRVAYENPTTPENLRKMASRLGEATGLILPGETLDAVCYGCTAASVVIGDDEVAAAVQTSRPGVPVITPTGAARLALTALGVSRVAILTPYLIETSAPMATYFARHGFEVTRLERFGLVDDREMARISTETITEAAVRLDEPHNEAVFICCTALSSARTVGEIESRTGKPVVTSNQACAWALMRHLGLGDCIDGFGRLFELDLPGRVEAVT